mgnify:CR=1 FL=1
MTHCCPSREGPIAFWGSSGVCVGCCLSEDAKLAAAPLVQSLFFRPRGRWPPRECRRHVMVVGTLVPPDAARVATSVATVYTSAPKQHRGAILADLCTLLRSLTCPQRRNSVHECPKTAPRGRFRRSVYTPLPHGRSRDRVGLWVPRHRRPHGSYDARALGSEAHAARAVTRPPTHTNSRSLPFGRLIDTGKRVSERVVRDVWNVVMMLYLSYAHGHQEPFEL